MKDMFVSERDYILREKFQTLILTFSVNFHLINLFCLLRKLKMF